jgi:cytidylate kinase
MDGAVAVRALWQKSLQRSWGYLYVDSGAMYRAITLYFLRNHVDWTDKSEVKKALKEISLEFIYKREKPAK